MRRVKSIADRRRVSFPPLGPFASEHGRDTAFAIALSQFRNPFRPCYYSRSGYPLFPPRVFNAERMSVLVRIPSSCSLGDVTNSMCCPC